MICHTNHEIQKFIDTDCAVVAVIAVAIVFSLSCVCVSNAVAEPNIHFHFPFLVGGCYCRRRRCASVIQRAIAVDTLTKTVPHTHIYSFMGYTFYSIDWNYDGKKNYAKP